MQRICAGNWKAHGSRDMLCAWADKFEPQQQVTTVLCVPHPLLALAAAQLPEAVEAGAQDIAEVAPGKHTGETTAELARDSGAAWTLAGHSERRAQGESDATIAAKLARAAQAGLRPVLCVGETLPQRKAGKLEEVLAAQLRDSVPQNAPPELLAQLVVAYEPVWAIGTGIAAEPREAQQACAYVAAKFAELHGSVKIPVIYGGSVDAGNAQSFVGGSDVRGLLVGGASLQAGAFSEICRQVALAGD